MQCKLSQGYSYNRVLKKNEVEREKNQKSGAEQTRYWAFQATGLLSGTSRSQQSWVWCIPLPPAGRRRSERMSFLPGLCYYLGFLTSRCSTDVLYRIICKWEVIFFFFFLSLPLLRWKLKITEMFQGEGVHEGGNRIQPCQSCCTFFIGHFLCGGRLGFSLGHLQGTPHSLPHCQPLPQAPFQAE